MFALVIVIFALWHNEIGSLTSMTLLRERDDSHQDGAVYSMDIKDAAQNSLFVILFSQATAVGAIVAGQGLAGATVPMIFGMIACGIAGGIVGRAINRRIDDAAVNRLFVGLMVVICGICCYNVWRYAFA